MGYISPTLAVRDMKKTIDFYEKSLGFKIGMCFPDINNPDYADLSKDGMVLMFIPAANLGIDKGEKFGIGVNLYLQIDGDIDGYYNELKSRGVEIVVDIKDEPFGIRDFTVEDIDAYKLTFNQVSKTAKSCMSCDMPLSKPEDFGGGNPENLYCVHCCNSVGFLKSRDEVLEGMVSFMMNTRNLDRESAEVAAKQYMSMMPAWSS